MLSLRSFFAPMGCEHIDTKKDAQGIFFLSYLDMTTVTLLACE